MPTLPQRITTASLVRHFRYFYRYLGRRVWVSLIFSLLVALLDGVGLTLFIPLIESIGGDGGAGGSANLGRLTVVLEAIQRTGVTLTPVSVLLLLMAFFAFKGVALYAAEYYRVTLRQRFSNSIRLENMALLAGYDYRAFSRASSGRIQNSFSGEVGQVVTAYQNYFGLMQRLVMLSVYVALAYLANPRFALLVAVGGLLTNFLFTRVYRITKAASQKLTAEMHRFQGFLIQSVASFKYLKATGLMMKYKAHIDQSTERVESYQRKMGQMDALSAAVREPLIISVVALAILIQIYYFEQLIGPIILSLLFLYRGLTYLGLSQSNYTEFLRFSGALDNLREFTAELRRDQETHRPGGAPFTGLGRGISLNDLRYDYDGVPVLRGLNLDIPTKQTIGVVGESGAGKTTLVNVICGLLKVAPGMLTIGGVDSTAIDVAAYRSSIGYVTQETQIFSATIRENISFWATDGEEPDERVWTALERAHAADFVRALPQGLDTVIGINGINLSGGQRQRVSIARELYRDVELLILDEATSSLDSQSEKLIQQNIEELSGRYTLLVVAHRLSTIRTADQIIYLDGTGGYLVGTFADLQRRSAGFRDLVALQRVA